MSTPTQQLMPVTGTLTTTNAMWSMNAVAWGTPAELKATDARKTYRYLRIGMVLAVVLLAASIAIEYAAADCWQTSISAYYYTPVRGIFVGAIIAVGFSLIVIKGRSMLEDTALNFAGIFAPIVAVAPTTDVGNCWSLDPQPLPINEDGSLATWVTTNVHNNFYGLLIAGFLGLGIAVIAAIILNQNVRAPFEAERGTTLSLVATAFVLAVGWWAIENWDAFYTRAHGLAAVVMFLFLFCAVAIKAFEHKRKSTNYFPLYSAIAVFMAIGGGVVVSFRIGGEHTVLVLEAYEIVLFALFWVAQTAENWHEEVVA